MLAHEMLDIKSAENNLMGSEFEKSIYSKVYVFHTPTDPALCGAGIRNTTRKVGYPRALRDGRILTFAEKDGPTKRDETDFLVEQESKSN